MSTQIVLTELIPGFVKLLKDPEAEVRSVSAGKISSVCKMLEVDLIRKIILPCIRVSLQFNTHSHSQREREII
jgi:hypothetical protein